MTKKFFLTRESYNKLEEELNYLSTTKRVEIAKNLKAAAEYGDLKENSEFDAEKQNQNNLQEDNYTFKSRNPNILRFKINGYNILDSIQTVFISKPENDGSFLLTADRIYYVNQKQRKETVYVLFKAIGSNGSSTTFQIEPEIVQDVKNQNSFVYKMAQRDDLTAKKTGNLVVINNSDKNMQIDMLIDIDA